MWKFAVILKWFGDIFQDPTQDAAGMYKCIVRNDQGEINANLTLNIQVAPEDATSTTTTTTTRKTSTTMMSVKRKKLVAHFV